MCETSNTAVLVLSVESQRLMVKAGVIVDVVTLTLPANPPLFTRLKLVKVPLLAPTLPQDVFVPYRALISISPACLVN
jgi:hypothetical protein